MDDKKAIFQSMPARRALAKFALPTILSQLISLIYNLADTYFVGNTNDPNKVAAVTLTLTPAFLLIALANLFGVGGGSLISRLLGESKEEEASKVSAFSFYCSVGISVLYTALCYFLTEPLLLFLGASEATLQYSKEYMLYVVIIGSVPTTVGLTMSHLLRSVGFSRQAGTGLMIGGLLNLALDPLFMFVLLPPGMEVAGAAIATLISNAVSLIYFFIIYYLVRKKTVLTLSPKNMLPSRASMRSLFAVGFPSALGTFLACVSNLVVNKLTAGYGEVELAAIGIVKKVDTLPMNVGMGLCQGMIPLIAYNYAAKNYKRMRAVSNDARFAGIAFACLCIIFFEIFPTEIIRIFIKDPATVALGARFLRIACLAIPFMIVNVQMSYTFQAMGHGKQSLILSACRQGIINVPLLFIMRELAGLEGIVWTQFLADALTVAISLTLYFMFHKKLKIKEEAGK